MGNPAFTFVLSAYFREIRGGFLVFQVKTRQLQIRGRRDLYVSRRAHDHGNGMARPFHQRSFIRTDESIGGGFGLLGLAGMLCGDAQAAALRC